MNNRNKEKKPTTLDYILAGILCIIGIGIFLFCLLGAFLLICWYPGFAALCIITGLLAGGIRNL